MYPVCVLLCVVGVSVWSWSALQFVLQDLKIALANTPSVHPLFVLYCIVHYKREREYVCMCVCAVAVQCLAVYVRRRMTVWLDSCSASVPCKKATIGVQHVFCLTIQLPRAHTQPLMLCCASQIVHVYVYTCVCAVPCLSRRPCL